MSDGNGTVHPPRGGDGSEDPALDLGDQIRVLESALGGEICIPWKSRRTIWDVLTGKIIAPEFDVTETGFGGAIVRGTALFTEDMAEEIYQQLLPGGRVTVQYVEEPSLALGLLSCIPRPKITDFLHVAGFGGVGTTEYNLPLSALLEALPLSHDDMTRLYKAAQEEIRIYGNRESLRVRVYYGSKDDSYDSGVASDNSACSSRSATPLAADSPRRCFDILIYHVVKAALEEFCLDPEVPRHMVLDSMTGTGLWAMGFADEHRGAAVIGRDFVSMQPKWVPPNCEFETVDPGSPGPLFDESRFDFVRTGRMALTPEVAQNIHEILRSGGTFEMHAVECVYTTLPKHSKTYKLLHWMATQTFLIECRPVEAEINRNLLEDAGFKVDERTIRPVPLSAIIPILGKVCKMPDAISLYEDARDEMGEFGSHICFQVHVDSARKEGSEKPPEQGRQSCDCREIAERAARGVLQLGEEAKVPEDDLFHIDAVAICLHMDTHGSRKPFEDRLAFQRLISPEHGAVVQAAKHQRDDGPGGDDSKYEQKRARRAT